MCGSITLEDINESPVLEVNCNMKGQYLSIELPGVDYLTLCEVQAFVGKCEDSKCL